MHGSKKLFIIFTAFLIVALFSVEAKAEKKIGILLFSKEVRYVESQKGIMDQLEKDGLGKSAVKYTIKNAGGSKAKATEIARNFSAAKMDLIFTIGTNATTAATIEIKHIPIVFSTVFDPVESGIAKGWKSSGNNTTGTSTKIPMSTIMKILKEFAPIKKLAVLYTPGEKNTEAQLIELQKIQKDFQIKVIPIILTRKEEVSQNLSEVIQTIDALYLTGSSVVGETIPTIVNIANKAHVVTITHLDDVVEKGVLIGVCSNSYQLGRFAGGKAVQIFKGVKPSSIPIETVKKIDLILNMKTAKAGQFKITSKFMEKVTKTIE